MTPFALRPVAPLGSELLLTPIRDVAREFLRYPNSLRGETMRMRRARRLQSLERAAEVLGLTPTELEGLELGRATLVGDGEWERAEQMLRDAATGPTGVQVVAAVMRGTQ